MTPGRIALLAATFACLAVEPARSTSPVTVKVTPPVAMAPAFVIVRTTIEADDDNRMLEVTAESENLFRSSQIPLGGAHAPRTNEVRFTGLPEGRYEITATVVGSRGQRAAATGSILVARGVR